MRFVQKPPAFSWFHLACAAVIMFYFLRSSPVRAQSAGVEGATVTEVRVVDESGAPVREKIPALALQAGKPFDFAAERESLRTIYGLGDYSMIRVTTVEQPGGIRVDFIATPNVYNNVIRVAGLKPPPTEPAALASLRMTLGTPFRESALREGVARLQDALRDDGLYQAKITWSLSPHPETREMDVTINVDQGPRALVGAINLTNKTSFPDAELLRRAKLTATRQITASNLSRASQRVRKFLSNQGYLGADAVITHGTYDPQTNRLPLDFSVVAGPRIRVDIDGARLTAGKRKALIPVYAEGAVDEDLLQEGRRNIRDYLQSQGYFSVDVQVSSTQDEKQNERVITYLVNRGDRFRLAGISFEGNKYFRTSLLMRRLQMQTASFANSGRFSQQLLRGDTDSVRKVYLSNGFRDVQVTSSVDDHHLGKKDNLYVAFHIVEGPQTRIESLQIEGNHAISTQDLIAVTGSTRGEPFSEAGVASDRNNILALDYNEGFPEATFHEISSPGDHPNEVRLTYQLTEGRQIEVSQVLMTGYQFTRPGIIRRQIAIEAGGPSREADIAKTQRQLYNLGIFTRVQIAPQNPDGSDPDKTYIVQVQEGDRYTIAYGAGFEVQRIAGSGTSPGGTTIGASPRGILEISRANMFGRAQTISFRARASTLEYRFDLGYTADNFLANRKLSLQITGYADKTQDVDTFTSTRFEGGLQLVQKLSTSSSLLYRYFYRRVEASNLAQTINPEQIPLLSQPTLVSGFGITYARDRRDNPADPKRGTFNTIDVSDAIEAIGSSADFFRGYFQNSSYYTLGRNFVFARSVRFGAELPYGNTVEESTTPPPSCTSTEPVDIVSEIPLPERFFAGGGTTLRGFSLNQAGPRDPCTGFPIGGLALLIFNQELRFPMRLPWVGNRIGGTIFYDGGNVYSDVSSITLRWKAPSLTNLNYFSHTVGFGFRYGTPIGPVRIDLGYQLNPAAYQATNTTTGITQTLHLPHFGFSFNIGPVF